MNSIMESLYHRKSVRVYEDRPVSDELKNEILDAAMQASEFAGICISCRHAGIRVANTAADGSTKTTTLRAKTYRT